MDDSGVADAFYTVLSIGIVLVAALAVSGVVLSATQGSDALPADFGPEGMKEGLYCFYYSVDALRSDHTPGDPDDIVLRRLAAEGNDKSIAFNAGTSPSPVPGAMGAIIWSGLLYAPADDNYELELSCRGAAWLWVDGSMAMESPFSDNTRSIKHPLKLSKGYHAFKAKYFYPELSSASCSLAWSRGGNMVPVTSFYR